MDEKTHIYLASDHAGYSKKEYIKHILTKEGYLFTDLGPFDKNAVDYPDYAYKMAEAMQSSENSRGILLCGTGIGISIAANRFSHIRAALCYCRDAVTLCRAHNDANVLVFPARIVKKSQLRCYLKLFLQTPFEGARHKRRVEKLSQLSGEIKNP
jgi:ribose 5-phosphate isomerase B